MQQLICPKCQGTMRQYERNGVNVDQCSECRGIFLDRGELERLIDAEASWQRSSPSTTQPQAHAPSPAPHYEQQHQQYGHKRKRKSFFEDLFD